MRASVIVRTKDEAGRLRLCLESLSRQTVDVEVIVVNDGSTDRTRAVLDEAPRSLRLEIVDDGRCRGRSGASNAGARIASGDLLLFVDGDVVAAPELVEAHLAAHAVPGRVGRGETFHLRSTRFFLDPETGTPRAGSEADLAGRTPDQLQAMRVTRRDIVENFAAVDLRASPGIYPGTAARRLFELEMDALHNHPDCEVLWAAASGHNLSVPRDAFLRSGGFLEALDLNEHRELALRLCDAGLRMVPVAARTYHLTHRTVLRDPLQENAWEQIFYRAHPTAAVKLLAVFWASLSPVDVIPAAARIASLPELAVAARGGRGIDYDAVRAGIPGLRSLVAGT